MHVHLVSLIGKRDQNEDNHNSITNIKNENKEIANINFFSIYDGHGGKFVSNFLSKNLPTFFTNKKVKYPLSKKYVTDVYSTFNNIFETKYNKETMHTGSTCLIVIQFKVNNKYYLNVLNSGDCRAIICRNNIEFCLTKDHKPNSPEESTRIKNLGGQIIFDGYDWRIGDLSVSRAFGDLDAKPYVTSMPDLFTYKISSNDKFIVMGCDGLWDVYTNQDVINFVLDECYDIQNNVNLNKKNNVAKKLAQSAISKGSTDNISVIIIFLDDLYKT
jgi:serine/threonine protein phosphatase PrpC